MRRRGCSRRLRRPAPSPSACRSCPREQGGLGAGSHPDRQREVEGASPPDLAVDPDATAMERHQALGDREAEAGSAGLMPTPVSATETVTQPSAAPAETETAPRSVNFTALASMFAST